GARYLVESNLCGWRPPGLQPEDLGHEPGLLDLDLAGEANHPPAGGSLHRGAEGRLDRPLVLGVDVADRLPVALLDQEFLTREQVQPMQQDDHRVVQDVRLRPARRTPVGICMDSEKVAADLVGDLLARGGGDLAPLGVRIGWPRW